MKVFCSLAGLVTVLSTIAVSATAADPSAHFEIRDGDRVVFLGDTFFERSQRYGHIETALTRLHPNAFVTFRNLGWSGDTVFAESRGIFDPPAKGYARMIEHVARLKPTIVFVGYGANESFAGETGLPRFVQQYRRLIADLSAPQRRFVFVSPHPHEGVGGLIPPPTERNKRLELYSAAVRELADELGSQFLSVWPNDGTRRVRRTDNGMHLTNAGYRLAARHFEEFVGHIESEVVLRVDASRPTDERFQVRDLKVTDESVRFRATWPVLQAPQVVAVNGLPPGQYELRVDGAVVKRASAEEWARGRRFENPTHAKQMNALRGAIVLKNELYFHAWRPQNITYLFGFRKHEQGQNAKEVAQFEKLVVKHESQIGELRRPAVSTYELVPSE